MIAAFAANDALQRLRPPAVHIRIKIVTLKNRLRMPSQAGERPFGNRDFWTGVKPRRRIQ